MKCFLKIVEQDRGKWKKRRGEGRERERKTYLESVVKTRVRTGGEEREQKNRVATREGVRRKVN